MYWKILAKIRLYNNIACCVTALWLLLWVVLYLYGNSLPAVWLLIPIYVGSIVWGLFLVISLSHVYASKKYKRTIKRRLTDSVWIIPFVGIQLIRGMGIVGVARLSVVLVAIAFLLPYYRYTVSLN